ncbi:hypothetical protein RQP53_19435 [Paucibacter sp. APW11]|uniref:Phosphotyrosine protein phosphatase I domain-containing protein n=1 Tax=Roseateles aquae TaxID=3077235 RepID=A0ABU3PG05_9BURK|nr:hypothetical protein [Paucibacter sp. APW11]MDT9001458.1 hypothetical protein [Paucibacter sp. APW11]
MIKQWGTQVLCRAALFATLALAVGSSMAQGATSAEALAATAESGKELVFVCEHGSAKSVIAAAYFNQMAAARGLAWRAVSRGLSPDAALQGATAQGLLADGIDLQPFARPQALTAEQSGRAPKVVSIGVERLPAYLDPARLEQWNDIPAVSKSYVQARDTMKRRIDQLLDGLSRTAP